MARYRFVAWKVQFPGEECMSRWYGKFGKRTFDLILTGGGSVAEDIPAHVVAMGVPARPKRNMED